jgi:hypothetical protein
MSSFHKVMIGGYPTGGLVTDQKPLMIPDEAYSLLQNAYVFRKRTKKRSGTVAMGRLRRVFTSEDLGTSGASPWSFNIYTALSITPETYAEIAEGSVQITISGLATPFTDAGNGNLTNLTNPTHNHGTINYITGDVVLTYAVAAADTTINFGYYPALPSMGICKRDVSLLGIDNTVFFDTKYSYQYVSAGFQELVLPGASGYTTWTGPNNSNGTNTYFFWTANYQGSDSSIKCFYVTNNNITSTTYDPIRYYDPSDSEWHNLTPLISSTTSLWQALIIIPYYGRLLALNTWEGTTSATYTGAKNYYSRCRFCQIGDPTVIGTTGPYVPGSWASDVFGKGGFLDAPTNEQIVGAAFFRNTLLVFFEYSTWQLRYIGEYGLPFIFERISSDFGSVSTFSSVIFDRGVMTVSNRGITECNAGGLRRLDEQIPETIFSFEIQNSAPDFVHGVRDFEKEIVYWNYIDVSNQDTTQVWPNTTLLYNYQNNTWAQFRDTITCFGTGQFQFGITWDSLTTTWDNFLVTWDNVDDQQYVDYTLAGNQQGFISIYENQDGAVDTTLPSITSYSPTLAIYAFDFSDTPTQITVPNHNFYQKEIIYIQGVLSSDVNPGINNQIYQITTIDVNTITLSQWDQDRENYVGYVVPTFTYIGGGLISLLPKMNIQGKDFSPFQGEGLGYKLSFIDFQMDNNTSQPAIPAITVQLFINSYIRDQANYIPGYNQYEQLSNQEVLNASQNYGFITNIETEADNPLANPCTITSPEHSLETGTLIYIANALGTTQVNNSMYLITVVDANNFTLNGIDATGWSEYISGGIWNTSPIYGQVYQPGSQYAWYRFYSTQFGQYLRIGLTYDDTLMNQLSTHQLPFELNAMNCFFRKGGRLINQ